MPGIDTCVVYDTTLDAKQTFNETAGFSYCPALQVKQDDGEGPVLFLEKLGVSDPENVLLHGQSFIASALHNLVKKPSDRSDLIIHQSSCPVRECDNPSFFQVCIQHYIYMELEVLRIQHALLLSLFRSRQIIILILQTTHSDIITHSSLLL